MDVIDHPGVASRPSAATGAARRFGGLLAATAAALLALAPAAHACDDDLPKVGFLGIRDLNCDCSTSFSVASKDGHRTLVRRWTFRGEPVVRGIDGDGPAAGRLHEGDVITAVDGALITTREGSERFSNLSPGQKLTLTVRRDGRELPVPITVGAICPEELAGPFSMRMLIAPRAEVTPPVPPAPAPRGATPATPPMPAPPAPRAFFFDGRAPRALPRPEAAPEALPRGWLGIGLSCQDCGGELPEDGATPVWTFGTLPTISYVDPEGPAARAGLRRGDQLTHLDGVSLLTPDGGRRFGAVRAGQTVKWTLVRDGSTRTIAVTAAPRPGDRGIALDEMRDQLRAMRERRGGDIEKERLSLEEAMRSIERMRRVMPRSGEDRRLRYAGSVAGSDVEVRGLGNVVVDDSGDEIVITTPEATIRIHPSAKGAPTPKPKPGK